MYINKEQRCNDIVELAHMFDVTLHVGLGFGWVCNEIVELAHMFDAT